MFIHKAQEATHGLSEMPVSALRYNATGEAEYESTYWIMSFIRQGTRVLDIGCGTGSITSTIKKNCFIDIVGVEPNTERANAAKSLGLEVINGVYTDHIPRTYGKFDYILFADVLEHLENPANMLTLISDALAPGGQVIASIPNVAHWTVRLNLLLGRFNYKPVGIMDVTHLRWFTLTTAIRLFESSGYKTDAIKNSAGAWMPEYQRTPLRFLPTQYKGKLLSKLGQLSHGLFACQHVILASPVILHN